MQYSSLHSHSPSKKHVFFPIHPRSHCAQQPYPQYPTISSISNPLLQTMSGTTVTAASRSLKTDISYSEMMDASGLSEGRRNCLKHVSGLIFFIWDNVRFYGCVCIVHMNNSASVMCIVYNCTLITLANSFNNISTSRSSSSKYLIATIICRNNFS